MTVPRSLAVGLRALAAVVAAAAVWSCSEPPPEWRQADGYRVRELRVDGEDAGFTPLEPSRTGIDFANELTTEQALDNEHLLIGSGVAVGDVDGDGLADVYLTRLDGENALYRNRGGFEFEEITDSAGVGAPDRFSTGAAMADVDGDGDLDLVVVSLGGPDVVYLNDGDGRFTETDAGLADGGGSSTVSLADVDGDGDLDLYVTAYKAESASDLFRLYERPGAELRETITVERGDSVVVAPEYREHFRMETRDGEPTPVEQADEDALYLNDGSGRFERVPWTEGAFLDEAGEPLERPMDDYGLAARFHDVNGDGHPDLYVCNDFDDPDQLWLNRGDGTFRAVPDLALRTTSHASMSVDFSDIDRDGATDVFVAEMQARDLRRRLREIPFHDPYPKPVGAIRDRPQVQRNTLFLNRGDATFAEIGRLAGVHASEWSWASLFLDVDLDGYEDLLVANGYSRDTQNGDVVERIDELRGQATTRELKRLFPEYRNRNAAFRNRGDLTFEDTGRRWGMGSESDISHGMAAGDLDGDGDLDVVVNRLGSPARVLRNDAGGSRVAVRLRGDAPNTRGIGAEVRLLGGAVPVQSAEMTAGGLYLSGSSPQLAFAAGEPDSMTLEVEWPDGARSVVGGVRPDRLYEIRPAAGRDRRDPPTPDGGRARDDGPDGEEPPLFADRTELLDHRHPEEQYADFRRQLLLPYRPSRLGPGVSWIDVDTDGDPDLVVPPGTGGRLTVLRNDEGFSEVALEDSAAGLDRTAAVPLPGPDGSRKLVVGQSSFEVASEERTRDTPSALVVDPEDGTEDARRLPSDGLTASGPVAVADVDTDGDLDVFVGGRIVEGGYPVPATSRLFVRDGDELRPDRRNRDLLEGIGMVSGAVFSDVDGDGAPDLVLALEWGAVRVLVNQDGRFEDRTEEWGLDDLRGRWNGVTAGDLNGDGRMDLVVTGWGRNLRPRPSEDRPFVLFTRDFDRNGTWDFLPTRTSRDGGEFVPLEPYDRVRRALPTIRSRLSTYEAYSEASLETVLGMPPQEAYSFVARTYDHHLLLNRGGGFEAVPLPVEAQMAPATGVSVGDLDGDGREDVFLSQNFFPVSPDQARHDAGLGLVLLGDGEGGLEPVPASRSGVRIHGDQRGAALADYDGDARVDLAVAQNGGPTRLFRNVAARRGLRVRLEGPPGNPDGIGAVIRVLHGDGPGPAREVHGGSGYWSMDGTVQVMGLSSEPTAVRVLWPGGQVTRTDVPDGAREVTVRDPGR